MFGEMIPNPRGGFQPETDRFPFTRKDWQGIAEELNLTNREVDVVRAIFDGGSETSIAHQFELSPHTIHTHFDRLYKKLMVRSRTALVLRVFLAYLSRRPGATSPATSSMQA